MALPRLLVLFSLVFFSCSCFPCHCSSSPTWQLVYREKFLIWLLPLNQGATFLRQDMLVLLDPGQGSYIVTGRVLSGPWHCYLGHRSWALHGQCWWVLCPPPSFTS